MSNKYPAWTKARIFFKHWFRVTVDETVAPILDRNARLSYLIVAALIYFMLPDEGFEIWKRQVMDVWRLCLAFLYAIPAFFIINAILAIPKTIKDRREVGQWYKNGFYYNQDQLVFTTIVSNADNDKKHFFEVKDAEVGSLVHVNWVINRMDNKVKANVSLETSTGPAFDPTNPSAYFLPGVLVGLRLPKNKTLCLRTYAEDGCEPTKVRVYVNRWEL
jgi:hypothetical protein